MEKDTKLQIRSSTVDFLVFARDAGEDGIEVRVQNHDVWLTQKAIIAVGYRTNSARAVQFRQWATRGTGYFCKQEYVLDKDRLINGQIFDEDYFEYLISEIQEICASERHFYQKIMDIYATAVDYLLGSQITRNFFCYSSK